MDEYNEYAYMYRHGVKFRVKNYTRVGNVLEIRVKAIIRKNGVIVSSFLAELYDEKKGEWKKIEGRHEVNVASLKHPPERGKGLTLVLSLGIGGILCLHDPQPTFEDDSPRVSEANWEDEDVGAGAPSKLTPSLRGEAEDVIRSERGCSLPQLLGR